MSKPRTPLVDALASAKPISITEPVTGPSTALGTTGRHGLDLSGVGVS